jgi:hypothetical protein
LDLRDYDGGQVTPKSILEMSEITCGLNWQHNMAITQQREDLRTAQILRKDGWVHELCDLDMKACQERATWCHETFGRMYDDMTWSGKWYGAQLPFQSGGVIPKRQFVFMFRDDKLYTMYKMMWPE